LERDVPNPQVPRQIPGPARLVHDLLVAHARDTGELSGPLGVACTLLASAARPSAPSAARAMLTAAANAGLVTFTDDVWTLPPTDLPPGSAAPDTTTSTAASAAEPTTPSGPLRVIALDLEAAVRTRVEDGGTLTRAIWQIGAVRFGPDAAWVGHQSTFSEYVHVPDGFDIPERAKAAHAAQARPAADVLADLQQWLSSADMIVAYNGTGLDFPVLDGAMTAEGCEIGDLERVDGLYLAHCLWPAQSTYKLTSLMADLGLPRVGIAHDAVDDARNLSTLMQAAAAAFAAHNPVTVSILTSVTGDSAAWKMIRALAGLTSTGSAFRSNDIGAWLESRLAGQQVRRGFTPGPLSVPTVLHGGDGHVDPTRLALQLHPERTEARPGQQDVTVAIRSAAATGVPVLVEAPTGTGKSLAALAAALEWLDDDPRNTAIIATHSKQLQSQLASEVEELSAVVPGLMDTTDVVKGASNRLSLRGLVVTLSDCTGADVGSAAALIRYSDEVGYRELLAFLTLRLLNPSTSATYRWATSSVDPADLPAFFHDYLGSRLGAWATSLSQRTHGEYDDPARPLSAHTDRVAEALAAHRLVIANHALLLAHWPDLADAADRTLLIVDEAHNLEGAATGALSPELSTAEVDDAIASVGVLISDLGAGRAEVPALSAQLRETRQWWSDATLRRKVSSVLDRNIGDVGVGSRTLAIASPYVAEHAARDARALSRILRAMHGLAGRVSGALGAVADANAASMDYYDEQRLLAAKERLGALSGSASHLQVTIDALIGPAGGPSAGPARAAGPAPAGPAPAGPADGTGTAEVSGSSATDDDAQAGQDEQLDAQAADPDDQDAQAAQDDQDAADADSSGDDADAEDDTDMDGTGGGTGSGAGAAQSAAAVPPPDRVVYIREDGDIYAGLPRYRFTIISSPILLPNDGDWNDFTAAFTRLALLSATLQVTTPGKDPWSYIRTRLGLPHANVDVVQGPFNYKDQARLVALSDFPSWAEQPKQAMRTVAHQLTGWARQMIRHTHPDGSGPYQHGAMVLTTSKAAAGGIADALETALESAGTPVSVHNAVIYGNRRATETFKDSDDHSGGFLVGTRGLWTGVDISERDRLNIVWINKLPFPVFTDPVIQARREQVRRAAEAAGADDPDLVASSEYYLPLAALDLRQAVGRLIRNAGSRGAVIISDRKLAGDLPLRRLYRQIFLGSLDAGLHVPDATDPTDTTGGNVVPAVDAWRALWQFFADQQLISAADLVALTAPDALEAHTVLPATLAIRRLAMTDGDVAAHTAAGTLADEVVQRCEQAACLLAGDTVTLRPEQKEAIAAVAQDTDVLALLPTGSGKSYCFQLPALILPGVTVVISPLVALMHDQALSLNHTIGGAVRALVSSLPESSSRAGRTQVIEQMTGVADHGIRIVYVSPERLGQARFRDALTRGVAAGIVRRVAIDEAHTYVQWGDDFRPSFRRAGALLRELRQADPDKLTLMTLTATATRTVEKALREEVLAGLVTGSAGATSRPLVTVQVNALRPELTLARRRLSTRNTIGMTALAEQVLDAAVATGHVIMYCLTVKQVDAMYAHLRDYTGSRPLVLRKFHGRMSELEKAAVSGEFNEAPKRGTDGYAPMIVVATSAFGLGISRSDIRSVFCISPPTDLAALYQQLGRGGRDMATRPLAQVTTATYGLALATDKTLDTAEWLASQDLPAPLLTQFGQRVLAQAPGGTLDLNATRDALMNEHLAAGTLSQADSRDPRVRDAWKVGLTRAVAALADLGALLDLGDVPARVAVTEGTRPPTSPLSSAVLAAVLAMPVRAAAMSRTSAAVGDLHTYLSADAGCAAAGYGAAVSTVADLWLLLCDLHDAAVLDVSQRPNRHMLIGLGSTGTTALPAQFVPRVSGKLARATAEAAALRAFFATGPTCLNQRLADYFGTDLQAECCSIEDVMCSVCAVNRGSGVPVDSIVGALMHGRLRPAAVDPAGTHGRVDPAVRARRVDEAVIRLLRQHFNGVTARHIRLVLIGERRVWVPSKSQYKRLPHALIENSQFGQLPTVTEREVLASLERLRAAGSVDLVDTHFWRTQASIAAGPRRPFPRQRGASTGPANASAGTGSAGGTTP
jgi:RecQ family ATP-dependent DNA helicase